MAEELGWDAEAFDKAFKEVSDQGMAEADFKARLVWLPKAIIHNKPESPNVVRSWRAELDLLPECALKSKAIEFLADHLKSLGDGYFSAFCEITGRSLKARPKPSRETCGKATPNQEQEQEQEQESGARKRTRSPPVTFRAWMESLPEGEHAIRPDDPIYRYADSVGISDEIMALAWFWFERTYTGARRAKRYADWRQAFRNAVEGNWGRLWRVAADGAVVLTSEGEALRRLQQAEARREAA